MSLAQKQRPLKQDIQVQLQRAEERVVFLREISLFADVLNSPGALEEIARAMEVRTFKPDECIIKEGETGTEMFVLVDGQASVNKSTAEGDQYKVAILTAEKHPFFGEGGLLDSDARSATIKADSVCSCLVLKREAFDAFGLSHPEWAMPILLRIARAVMARFRKTNNDLTLLYNALVAEIRGS